MKAVSAIAKTTVGEEWYRCIKDRGQSPTHGNFRAPSEEQEWPIHEGRYNHAGQPHWYLADSEITAIGEVLDDDGGVVWVQRFKIKPCKKVLDLCTSIDGDDWPNELANLEVALALVMMGSLDSHVDRKKAWKPEYLLPRFVMDAAKLAGFEGIRYRSVRSLYGQNLVLFNRDWPAEHVGEPVRHEREAYEWNDQIFT